MNFNSQDISGEYLNAGSPIPWSKYPYGVRLPEDPGKMFSRLIEQEDFSLGGEVLPKNQSQFISDWFKALKDTDGANLADKKTGTDSSLQNTGTNKDGNFNIYELPNYTDTRVGGNDAINPYWQFNRDDDIVPKMLHIQGVTNEEEYGMGRVYSERYDSNQQILWLCMGVAEFTDLISFYMDSGDYDAAKAMNRGSIYGLTAKFLKIATQGVIWAFTFPITAPFWLYRWINRSDGSRITKYYWFLPSMTLYYEMVNTMLSYLAVGMGLYPTLMKKRMDSTKMLNEDVMLTVAPGYNPVYDAWGADKSDAKYNLAETGIPELLRDGPDIFVIMNRRVKLFNAERAKVTTRDLLSATRTDKDSKQFFSKYADRYEYDENASKEGKPIWKKVPEVAANLAGSVVNATFKSSKNLYSNIKGTMFGAGDFVGFRIERSSNASENVSNETGPTAIAQKLNSVAQQARDEYETSMGGNMLVRSINAMTSEGGIVEGLGKVAKQAGIRALASLTAATGFGDIGAILTHGNGFLDIPDVWKSSSFSKNYSFTIDLYSRYGDAVSIYQSVYIPMIMLLAASLPRAIGSSMYTSPFLIKAFCKGQFSVPCGVVSNINIIRGKEEHGWSVNQLPTQVSVSIDIKDMTPAMFMGMQDIGLFDTMARNESLHEYLDTLSALGISERIFIFPQAIRKASAALLIKRNTIFSSTYWGSRMGRTGVAKALAYLAPFGNHERTDIKYNTSTYK